MTSINLGKIIRFKTSVCCITQNECVFFKSCWDSIYIPVEKVLCKNISQSQLEILEHTLTRSYAPILVSNML